ncbi:MAG: hypothetical protein LUG52_00915 [Clostridia bacterium]|nr:hypothetical protein [Clostridia bacterium]
MCEKLRFLEYPYLPEGDIAVAVANKGDKEMSIIEPFEVKILPRGLRRHADLTFCYLGLGEAVCAPESYEYYAEKTAALGLKLTKGEKTLGCHYPGDSAYNVATIGRKMFCRVDITDARLLRKAAELGYEIIKIKQGYAKCSVCPITPNAAISADVSFCRAAERAGADCLLITNEQVKLEGYDNGFFGGAAYMKNKTTLCAKGDLRRQPDYEKICAFLARYGIEAERGEGEIEDFGSLCGICEKSD